MSAADAARVQLRALADDLELQATVKSVEAIGLAQRSARIAQMAAIATDEIAIQFRDALVKDGALVVVTAAGGQG